MTDFGGDGTSTLQRMTARRGPLLMQVALFAIWCYVVLVLVYGEPFGGRTPGPVATALILVAGTLGIAFLPRVLRRIASPARMFDIGVAGLASLAGLLLLDIGYSVATTRGGSLAADDGRDSDRTVWHGELEPRTYFPTPDDFVLYKPDVLVTATVYGAHYRPAMRSSPLLRDSLLEARRVSYNIGPLGMRDQDRVAGTRLFALGDSFTFGFAIDDGLTWVNLLEARLGEPVYNLGVSDTGPRQQLSLLEYLLREHADSLRIDTLLWMIFEGNDLEASYDRLRSVEPTLLLRGWRARIDGTILGPLLSLPQRLKDQSVARKLVRRELRLGAPGNGLSYGRIVVDGVHLDTPLFRSGRLGYHTMSPYNIRRAMEPAEYVQNHPNRPRLDQTFAEMRALASRSGFQVMVIIAPNDVRLHGSAFDGVPPLSDRAHFIEYVAALAERNGFTAFNLLPLLRPYAEREFLYYRDDVHWNPRGNEIVAQLIADALGAQGRR